MSSKNSKRLLPSRLPPLVPLASNPGVCSYEVNGRTVVIYKDNSNDDDEDALREGTSLRSLKPHSDARGVSQSRVRRRKSG